MKTIITIENGRVSVSIDDASAAIERNSGTNPAERIFLGGAAQPSTPAVNVPPTFNITPDITTGLASKPKAKPGKSVIKNCVICNKEFEAAGPGWNRMKYCSDECRAVKYGPKKVTDQRAIVKNDSATTYKTPAITHKSEFMPGYEKTDEELDSWRPQARLPEAVPKMIRSNTVNGFNDPWNCGQCRDRQSLCALHSKMERGGHKPTKAVLQ